jgi:hypothetical protein
MGLYQASDEGIKAILNDPTQTPGSAISNVGLSAALGGAFGLGTKAAGIATKAGLNKLGFNEFTERFAARAAGLDPKEALEKEFNDVTQAYHAMNDELTGPSGLKAQAMQKLLPKAVTPELSNQVAALSEKSTAALKEMADKQVPDRLSKRFVNEFQKFQTIANNPASSPSQIFDAMNEFKGDLQGYAKGNYGPFAVPKHSEAYDFINITKNLGHDVRLSLEDNKAWGKAADLQKQLNYSWTRVLPAVKDAQSKFMTKVEGEFVPDPAKFQTYLNTNGKATTSTIRQKMMGNFVDAMDRHFDAVDKAYQAAGVENPHDMPGMGALKDSLQKQSMGAKLADYWYEKAAPQTLAAGVGAGAGAAIHPALSLPGAWAGRELLGPVFGAVIPPMLEKTANSRALNGAMAFTNGVSKGNSVIERAAKGLFMPSAKAITDNLKPDPDTIKKLDEQVKSLGEDANGMADLTSHISEYLPAHGMAMSTAIGNAVQYLNSLRPSEQPTMPLNSKPVISKQQQAGYERALSIAQQPLMVLQHIKDGTLKSSDIQTLKTIYPDFYNKLSQHIMSGMADGMNDEMPIPYATRTQLGMFLGQPLDSTMTPQGIMGAQPVPKPPPQQQAQKMSRKGTTTLGKSNKSYMTSDQAAEADRGSRD